MITSVFKAIFIGSLIGALAFFAPFIIISFVVIALILKFAFRSRFRHGYHGKYHLAVAEKIRSMSDEEFAGYKAGFNGNHYHPCGYRKENGINS